MRLFPNFMRRNMHKLFSVDQVVHFLGVCPIRRVSESKDLLLCYAASSFPL